MQLIMFMGGQKGKFLKEHQVGTVCGRAGLKERRDSWQIPAPMGFKNTPKFAKFLHLAAKLIKIAERQNRQFYVILMGDE